LGIIDAVSITGIASVAIALQDISAINGLSSFG
jgi:hypothetical protein